MNQKQHVKVEIFATQNLPVNDNPIKTDVTVLGNAWGIIAMNC